jgi:hypothetical protein
VSNPEACWYGIRQALPQDPANERANGRHAKCAQRGSADTGAGTLAQMGRLANEYVTLIIRRSRVRSPPAPLVQVRLWSVTWGNPW